MVEQATKLGLPIPKALGEAPELQPSSFVFLDAFLTLESERPIGEVPAQIPFSKIVWYGENILEYEGDDLRYFIEVLRKVDSEVLSERLRARESAYGKSKGNTTKPRSKFQKG